MAVKPSLLLPRSSKPSPNNPNPLQWLLQNFLQLLNHSISHKSLSTGKLLHSLYLQTLIPPSTFLSNHFILLYSNCRHLRSARKAFDSIPHPNTFSYNAIIAAYDKNSQPQIAHQLFDEMPRPDSVSFNTLISAYARRGNSKTALALFSEMRRMELQMDCITFSGLVMACSSSGILVNQLHCLAIVGGFDSFSSLSNALISCYSKHNWLELAEKVFFGMNWANVASYNGMIVAYGQHGKGLKALELYREMAKSGMWVDFYTFAGVLSALSRVHDLCLGLQFHGQIVKKGLNRVAHVGSGLIDLYSKCGGKMVDCRKVFEEISDPDLVVWNTMISGHGQGPEQAVWYFREMQRLGHRPDDCSFSCVVSACADIASAMLGKQVHSLMVKSDIPRNRVAVENAMVNMYANCGSLRDCRKIFDRMVHRNIVSLNSMIAACAMHGDGSEALSLFDRMLESDHLKPDSISFVSILSACAHSGKVKEGEKYFELMQARFGIEPEVEHYLCMIDMFGRAGKLTEVESLIETMKYNPGTVGWVTILGACRNHGNIELAKIAANKLLELDPMNDVPYVMLANIHASAGQWEEFRSVKKLMKDRGVKKTPGFSWIEVEKKTHVFAADENSHPMITEIYKHLDVVMEKIRRVGYVPDLSWALAKDGEIRVVDREMMVARHSEKIAIAFGLLRTKEGEPIVVMKNLRICGDCHNAIGFISKVYGREITVRDTKRFHCFKDGKCSCGGYW